MIYHISSLHINNGDINLSGLEFQDRVQEYIDTLDLVVKRMRAVCSLKSLSEFITELPHSTARVDLLQKINFCKTEFSLMKAYQEYPFWAEYLQVLAETGKKLYQVSHSANSAFWKTGVSRQGLEHFLERISEVYTKAGKRFTILNSAYCFVALLEKTQSEMERTFKQLECSYDKRTPLHYQLRFLDSLENVLKKFSFVDAPELQKSKEKFLTSIINSKQALTSLVFNSKTVSVPRSSLQSLFSQYSNSVQKLLHTTNEIRQVFVQYLEKESLKGVIEQENVFISLKKESNEISCYDFWCKLNAVFERCGLDLLESLKPLGRVETFQLIVGSSILQYNATEKVLQLGVIGQKELFKVDPLKKTDISKVVDHFLDSLVLSVDKSIVGYKGTVSLVVNETPVYCNSQGKVTFDAIGLSGQKTGVLVKREDQVKPVPRSLFPKLGQFLRLFNLASSSSATLSITQPNQISLYSFSRQFLKVSLKRLNEHRAACCPTYADLCLFLEASRYLGLRSMEGFAQTHLRVLEAELRSHLKNGTLKEDIPAYSSNNVRISVGQAKIMSSVVQTYLKDVSFHLPIKEHIENLMTSAVITRVIPQPLVPSVSQEISQENSSSAAVTPKSAAVTPKTERKTLFSTSSTYSL